VILGGGEDAMGDFGMKGGELHHISNLNHVAIGQELPNDGLALSIEESNPIHTSLEMQLPIENIEYPIVQIIHR
jgi:hypothetical protein